MKREYKIDVVVEEDVLVLRNVYMVWKPRDCGLVFAVRQPIYSYLFSYCVAGVHKLRRLVQIYFSYLYVNVLSLGTDVVSVCLFYCELKHLVQSVQYGLGSNLHYLAEQLAAFPPVAEIW
jgi:hypothetical protein